MRKLVLILFSLGFSTAAMAQGANCNAAAAEKKLIGAAKTEFLKQCESASKTRMTVAAKDKKEMMMSKGKAGNCGQDASDL